MQNQSLRIATDATHVWALDNRTDAALMSLLYGLATGETKIEGLMPQNYRSALCELAVIACHLSEDDLK